MGTCVDEGIAFNRQRTQEGNLERVYSAGRGDMMDTPRADQLPPWFWKQLSKLRELHPELVAEALDQIWRSNLKLRRVIVIDAYLEGVINLSKAAELLGLSRWQLQQEFLEQGIPLRLGPETVEEARAEVQAWTHFRNQPE